MLDKDQIIDQMERGFSGEAWHGPSLMESLEGVDAATANRRAVESAHTIWELVLHVAVWKRAVAQRIRGQVSQPAGREDFPPVTAQSEEDWRAALDGLRQSHHELMSTFRAAPVERLVDIVPGKDYPFIHMMLGTVQHDCYHAGQVAILKKH
jgi:uncharacterized damage-inducible protein DinB